MMVSFSLPTNSLVDYQITGRGYHNQLNNLVPEDNTWAGVEGS